MAAPIRKTGNDALVLRPETGFVQEDVHTDLGHRAGFDQLALNRLGVVVQQFFGTKYGLSVFVVPRFQRYKIKRLR